MKDDDHASNLSSNETFEEVVQARLSRRGFLGGSIALGAATSLGGIGALLKAVPSVAANGPLLGFTGIAPSSADEVVVPEGYTARVLIAWGDPVSDGPAFKHDASNSAADQARQWGMHNDGVVYFPINGSAHGLLVQNNEYTDDGLLFRDGVENWNAEKTSKSLNAHGVSVVEISKRGVDNPEKGKGRGGRWRVMRPSKYARRITGQTPIAIGGPAAGHKWLQTSADSTGKLVYGTLNNCAMGFTPWRTYLACEENFNGFFGFTTTVVNTANPLLDTRTTLQRRYGIAPFGNPGTNFNKTHPRFNADAEPNEPNRFGWVVELDPFDPQSVPVKRTALGRLKHEGAWVQEARDGRIVVYMGDDERNEYIYRFVSADKWRAMVKRGVSPLDEGTLYVAKFKSDGTGEWLPLTPNNPALAGKTLAEILINTRAAADAVGATMMDRPEWIDTFPDKLTAIATLTNNNRRGTPPVPPFQPEANAADGSTIAGLARPKVDTANPRGGLNGAGSADDGNAYGHIITWSYKEDWTEPTFHWDIFALAGDPAVPAHGSTVNGDKYGSPDGIYVAPSGRLWIQTDVSTSTINTGAYAGFGHNQMLCADPSTRETRRFLVGPKQCEITGVFVTPDETTMFVGIQHPGETPNEAPNNPNDPRAFSTWPDALQHLDPQDPKFGRPRSSCIVITKDDGGPIGS